MDNCSRHKKEVAGVSDMKALAEMIGDLHYETLAELLKNLAAKIYNDGLIDYRSNRQELGGTLYHASNKLKDAFGLIETAWYISKPFMEDKTSKLQDKE